MRKFQCLVICVKAIIYLLLYNLHDCIFKPCKLGNMFQNTSISLNIQYSTFLLFKWVTFQKMKTEYAPLRVKSLAFQKIKIKNVSHKVPLVLRYQIIFYDLLNLRNTLENA